MDMDSVCIHRLNVTSVSEIVKLAFYLLTRFVIILFWEPASQIDAGRDPKQVQNGDNNEGQ